MLPILNWIGKDAVINHDKDVPFRLLKKNKSKSIGDSENLIVEGDNLEALKALLPYYRNMIKCIYIDPPYNTGTEDWIYNDNVNSPKIKKWLGKVVGGEGEDLTRHDKWLCMIYPRLKLLRELLKDDGVIFISIDENELTNLKIVCDDIFDIDNYIAIFVWKRRSGANDPKNFVSNDHEYILCYRKSKDATLKGIKKDLSKYRNPDNDPRGNWTAGDLTSGKTKDERRNLFYDITDPKTKKVYKANPNRVWRFEKQRMLKEIKEGKILFPKKEGGIPQYKRFANELRSNFKPLSSWIEASSRNRTQIRADEKDYDIKIMQSDLNQAATKELRDIFQKQVFNYTKPSKLLRQLIENSTNDDDIILDSFAGSGTTAQAVLQVNNEDGGNRKFILIELESNICKNITSQRVKKVIEGYRGVEGIGGGFQYAVLDKKLFNSDGRINEACTFEELSSYIFFTETKTILDTRKINKTLMDVFNDTEFHLIFDGIGNNKLDRKFLTELDKQKTKIIYADKCTVDDSVLKKYNAIFKQIPYEVREF